MPPEQDDFDIWNTDDQPSRAVLWARRWIIAVCVVSLVMGAVIVTTD